MFCQRCNNALKDESDVSTFLEDIVNALDMNIASGPHVKYIDQEGNRGATGIVIIETSHCAIHIWDEPDPCLIQFDVYTCGELIPKVIFVEVQDTPSGKFKTPKKLEFVVDRANILGRKNIQPGKKYSYKLDAAVLRNTSKIHFSAYITINGIDYGFDGESYSRLEKFNWKSKLNKNTQWRFAEQYETYFNFTKGYQILIYYRDS